MHLVFRILFVSLLALPAFAQEHVNSDSVARAQESNERETLQKRFCSEKPPGSRYGISAVLYNNRNDFRAAGDQHQALFKRMGIPAENIESLPFDVPAQKDSKESKSLVTRFKNLSDKILKDKAPGKAEVTIAISSHGNEDVVGRQNTSTDDA